MLKDSYQALEYFKLLEIISNYAESPLGKEFCLSLRPSFSLDQIKYRLGLISEIREFLNTKGELSVGNISPADPILERAKRGYLLPEEILDIRILIETGISIREKILSEGKEYKTLYMLAKSEPDLSDLVRFIKDRISESGMINDSASSRLMEIRKKKKSCRIYIQKRLEEILSRLKLEGSHVTVIEGRYVIGISSGKRKSIKGLFHGYSNSKATSFIEPEEIVEENNLLRELEIEEKEEEIRILTEITERIRERKGDIIRIQEFLKKIDGICAIARFCDSLKCKVPEISEDTLDIKGARNPILEYIKGCVPVDLRLKKDKNLLIISGPNRGGKTVALKTLGLLCLMTQTGIHIPAEEGSRIKVFKKIMAEIGDDQDISLGMSTFSAHIEHLRTMIESADKDSLIIIDEPGMGTDPEEGAALSMAILDYLMKKNAYIAISTHLNKIKLYGLEKEGVISAYVEFDKEKRIPTYRLNYGSAGASMAFETALRLGIPEEILSNAKRYLDKDTLKLNSLIEKVDLLVRELEREKEEVKRLKEQYERRLKRLEEEKDVILEEKRKEAENLIRKAKREFWAVIDRIKREKKELKKAEKEFSDIARELKAEFEKEVVKKSYQGEIKEGSPVYHIRLRQKGKLVSYDPEKKKALISIGNIRFWTDIEDIQPAEEEKEKTSFSEERGESSYVPEINVIGHRVDEAIPKIDKAIDNAILNGNPGLKIIHGIGTGRLRKAIREYLKSVPYVKGIKTDSEAVTFVELK